MKLRDGSSMPFSFQVHLFDAKTEIVRETQSYRVSESARVRDVSAMPGAFCLVCSVCEREREGENESESESESESEV